MRGLLFLKNVGNLIIGALLGGVYQFLMLNFWDRISWQINSVASAFYILSQYVGYIVIGIAILSHLAISRYLYYKRSPFLGLGFLMGLMVIVLFIGMFILELFIHPPEEE